MMEMERIKPALEWCLEHWSFVLFVIGMFVQFTPAIKFSPITAVCRWLGRAFNGEVLQRIAGMETSISGLETRADQQRKSIDENEMDRIRWEVLDFANACRNHVKHTKDEFQHIIALNEKYHKLLEKYGDENGVFDAEYDYILELYHECQHNNSFL